MRITPRAPRCMLILAAADLERRRGAIQAALAEGFDAVQLRDRRAPGGALFAAATELREITRVAGALLLVNDRIDVALAANADGAHLPGASFPIPAARRLLGPERLIGRSTHSPEEAAAAADAGADYVVLGPVFPTPSKAGLGTPLGVATIGAATLAVPLIAIGGITAETVPALRRAGANGIAVIRAVLDAPDPRAAARALVAGLREPS